MVLTDTLKIGDRFKNADGTPADFKRGRHIRHFVGSTYQHMLNQGWYLYIAPTVDTATEKFSGYEIITTDGTYITHVVIDMTAQDIIDRDAAIVVQEATQLNSDLQQATIASAILIQEAFTQMQVAGYLDASTLSDKAKAEFATLTTLVNSYVH